MTDDCPEEKLREVPACEILDKIQKGEDLEYDHIIVKGELDLNKLDLQYIERTNVPNPSEEAKLVESKIKITKSKIDGTLRFDNTIFFDATDFSESQFSGDVDFSRALFNGNVDFNVAQFSGDADFNMAMFGKNADFEVAKFSGKADFNRVQFNRDADFNIARFSAAADFSRVQFSGEADFNSVNFSTAADFSLAKFSGSTGFIMAQFSGDAGFNMVQFSGDAYFNEAQFIKKLSISMPKFERLFVRWEDIKGHLECDGAAYLALIKNFKNLELFEDADACYYQYRKISQGKKEWYTGPNRLIDSLVLIHSKIVSYLKWIMDFYVWLNKHPPLSWIHKFNWSKMGDHLSWVSCGYGLKLWPMLVWIAGAILIFAYVYNAHNGIAKDIGNTSPIDSLYFSIFALAGRTPPDNIHPVGLWRYVALLENLLGYVFLALFVVVLGRKVVR